MSDPAPQREATLTALEHLLAWPEIARSPQLARFLSYIVQRTLDGDEAGIKAYSIAVDVFGRPPEFDPQVDPIVRVQARRLRALLAQYYEGPGAGEVIRIQLPVGRYIPEFSASAEPAAEPPGDETEIAGPPPRRWSFAASWITLAVIALSVAMAAYALNRWQPVPTGPRDTMQPPSVTVFEFQSLAPSGATPAPQVAGLAIELVTDLQQFDTIVARYGGGGVANLAVADLPDSDFVLTGIVRRQAETVQYSAILTDTQSNAVVANYAVSMPAEAATSADVLDAVSKSFSFKLGSPRGPLHQRARHALAGDIAADTLNPYLCRMLFDIFRDTEGSNEARRAQQCFADLPTADQNHPIALAAEASLLVWQARQSKDEAAAADLDAQAEQLLQRAIRLDPESEFVWEQQARFHEAIGDVRLARADYSSAVQLNPASADALAAFARLLALDGSLQEAEGIGREAADQSPEPPAWYQLVPALLALRDGDYADAAARATLYAAADRELGPVIAVVAAEQGGDEAVVNRFLPQILDEPSFRAKGILVRLRERITDGRLLITIRDALIAAGVPTAALIRPF